jgi:2-methylisocitrate lyase-like PEP mutase family enzyme
MTTMSRRKSAVTELGKRFRELHENGTFVLPNAWDASSAAVIASAGARAIATTSSGISWSLGEPDGEHLSRDQMIGVVARIARVVDVPVSADVESGYGPSPDDVAATIGAVIEAGAVGVNLEDRDWENPSGLRRLDDQSERIGAARAAADSSGVTFTVNARTDVFLAAIGEPETREEVTLERAKAFAEAGADCLFVPGVTDLEVISRLVKASPLPINILLFPGFSPTVSELSAAGVRRISVGGAVASAALAGAKRAAELILQGDDSALRGGLSHMDMQVLMDQSAG